MALFPRAAQSIRAHSIFFQAGQVRDKDIGVVSGLAVTRSSATAVAIASGQVKYNNALSSYAGGSIGTIPAASSGKHRYDAIVYDLPTSAVKRLAGTEDTPEPYSGGFLNNRYPAPPELESETQALLAIIKVTQAGVVDENHGNYCSGGVADLRLLISDKLSVSNGDAHDHSGGDGGQISYANLSNIPSTFAPSSHASAHKSAGGDSIKLDELAAPTDNTTLDATTSAHGLMPKFPGTKQRLLGDKSWATGTFGVNFPFGNGSAVLEAEASAKRIPIASKITKAYVRSLDAAGALKTGSITIKIYVHDYNGSIGSEVDSFVLSNASSYAETGLNSGNGWTVAAGKYITAITSSITTCEQVTLDLELEAT